jgi:phosphoesterase, MJ0936 family
MRILIASDIHGSFSMASKFVVRAKEMKADFILLLGDILYHGPRNPFPDNYNPPEVVSLLSALDIPLAAVRGNCDAEVDQLVLPFHLAESLWLLNESQPILAIHGHQLSINGGSIDLKDGSAVLFGHTHLPRAEKNGSKHYWNPGSISLPKGDFPPSFGLLEASRFKVISFDGSELMSDSLQ